MHKKRSLKKNFRGSHKFPQAHEKVCDGNERKYVEEKNDGCIKYFDGRKEVVYKACAENSCNGYQMISGQQFLIH